MKHNKNMTLPYVNSGRSLQNSPKHHHGCPELIVLM